MPIKNEELPMNVLVCGSKIERLYIESFFNDETKKNSKNIRNIYDEFSKSELSSKIPTYQTAELNTRQEGVDFIYRKMLEADKYLYINVMTDKPDPIMIVTSMPIYDYITFDLFEYFPNPNTEQLLSTTGEKLRLAFEGDKGISVNFVTLNGNAELSWEGDPKTVFSLRGRGDRISLSSGKKKMFLLLEIWMQILIY
jgi:hypothetical protein